MNDLSGGPDIVIVAVNLNQTRIGNHAIHIVIQDAVFRNNAVLQISFGVRRFHYRRIHNLACFVEGIAHLRQQAVGLGDPVGLSVNDLAGGPDIVVVAVDLNQTRVGQLAIYIIVQAAVFRNNAVLRRFRHHHLTVFVEGVGPFGKQAIGYGAVVGCIYNQLTVALGVVVILTNFEQTHVNLDAVDVVIQNALILQDTVLGGILIVRDHTVFIEVVAPLGKQVIGLHNPIVLTALGKNILNGLAVLAEIVIIDFSAILNDPDKARVFHDLAVLDPIGIRSGVIQSVQSAPENASLVVEDEGGLMAAVLRSGLVKALDDVARIVEVVGIPVNGGPNAEVFLFTFYIVGGATLVGEPAVPELPLGIEGDIPRQVFDGFSVRIGCAGAIFLCVPAGELVVLTGKGVLGQLDICAVIE